MFDTGGGPGHTPFRSSRFMPPAEDLDDEQVEVEPPGASAVKAATVQLHLSMPCARRQTQSLLFVPESSWSEVHWICFRMLMIPRMLLRRGASLLRKRLQPMKAARREWRMPAYQRQRSMEVMQRQIMWRPTLIAQHSWKRLRRKSQIGRPSQNM